MEKPNPLSGLGAKLKEFQKTYSAGGKQNSLFNSGLIKENQLLQSIVPRGGMFALPEEHNFMISSSATGILVPISTVLSDTEYSSRKKRLRDRPSAFDINQPIRSFGESENRVVRPEVYAQLAEDKASKIVSAANAYLSEIRGQSVSGGKVSCEEAEKLLLSHQTEFMVEHDWHAVLSKVIKEVKDDEVQLPYQKTTFEFTYLETPMRGVVVQDPQTHALSVESLYLSPGPADLFVVRPWYLANDREKEVFLEHVRYICVAMETELAGKEQQAMPAFLKALSPEVRRSLKAPKATYKIRPLRQVEASDAISIPGVSGYKQRFHVRRSHWKVIKGERRRIKWYFAGNIELGFVIKDYILD